jgi:prepilin-type N-terminal cleavage/methylation domain-containing protein
MAHQLRRTRKARQRGVSLVEVLVALTILLIALVGIMPLFMRSMQSNTLGRQYTQSAQVAASRFEEFLALPLDREALTVPIGDDELENDRVWRVDPNRPANGGRWVDGTLTTAANSGNRFGAVATLSQYSVNDIESDYQAKRPLMGDTPAPQVHLRQLAIRVVHPRPAGAGGVLFPVQPLEITALRGF